eukprot:4790163-Pyramimonas_sp.AAC.1
MAVVVVMAIVQGEATMPRRSRRRTPVASLCTNYPGPGSPETPPVPPTSRCAATEVFSHRSHDAPLESSSRRYR